MLNFRSNTQSNYVPPPFEESSYVARVVQVIELGLQANDFDANKDPRNEVLITFEFPDVRTNDDRPAWLSKRYPVSAHNASALMALLKVITPSKVVSKPDSHFYDVSKLSWVEDVLNKPVMAAIAFTRNNKPKIKSVMAIPKGMPVGELENDQLLFEIMPLDARNIEKYVESWSKLPNWVRDLIANSPDEDVKKFAQTLEEHRSDDIPF